ncbi:MAG: hypothetical protein H0W41_00035 [Chloroflexi bacterium]|nr:hypothetical protein [Chloroflexota bacterium]
MSRWRSPRSSPTTLRRRSRSAPPWRLGARPNLLIKIPGTVQGLAATEQAIFAVIPINVTLLFRPGQYLACAEAYTRGIERRVAAGMTAFVPRSLRSS